MQADAFEDLRVEIADGPAILTTPPGVGLGNLGDWPADFKPQKIEDEDALKAGDLVLCPSRIGQVYVIVQQDDSGMYGLSPSGKAIYFFRYRQGHWLCWGSGHLEASQQLNREE